MSEPVYWWDENEVKHVLVDAELVSYERTRVVRVDGRRVVEKLDPVKFTVVTARRVE